MNELKIISTQGDALDHWSQMVIENADDGIELSMADIEQVERVDRVIEQTQNMKRACLYWMRQKKGWQILGYESFEDYGEKRFGYKKTGLHQLASAFEIQKSLSAIADKEIPESQLRPLAKVPEKERQAIWDEANRKAEEAGKARTAKMVDDAVSEWKQRAEKAEQEADELADSLERTDQQIGILKAEEQKRMEQHSADLRRQLKEAEEMTAAVKDQRDRLLENADREIEQLKTRLETDRSEYQAALESAKLAGAADVLSEKSAELAELERRAEMANERLTISQQKYDALQSAMSLSNTSAKTGKAVLSHLAGIDCEMYELILELDESGEELDDSQIAQWHNLYERYVSGEAFFKELLKRMSKLKLVKG